MTSRHFDPTGFGDGLTDVDRDPAAGTAKCGTIADRVAPGAFISSLNRNIRQNTPRPLVCIVMNVH